MAAFSVAAPANPPNRALEPAADVGSRPAKHPPLDPPTRSPIGPGLSHFRLSRDRGVRKSGGDRGGGNNGVRPMPISARVVCGAGCRVGAASDGSFQSGARRLPRLRRKRERVKANRVRSGCGELELVEGVEGALADLAGDGQSRHGGVAPLAGGPVEREVGGGRAVGVHGGFDQCPAKMR